MLYVHRIYLSASEARHAATVQHALLSIRRENSSGPCALQHTVRVKNCYQSYIIIPLIGGS